MDLRESNGHPLARHPWELARARFFCRVVREAVGDGPVRALDAGSGDGWLAAQIAEALEDVRITCWDPAYRERPIRDAGAGRGRLAFTAERPGGEFSLLMLMDVLEHVEDDQRLLGELVRDSLLPGGTALVSTAAWPALFSRHDVRMLHHRRYTPRAMVDLLTGSGLELLQKGGLFHSLVLVRIAEKVGERFVLPDGSVEPAPLGWRHGPLAGAVVEAALRADNAISALAARAGVEVPGLSWWALCRKPAASGQRAASIRQSA